MKHFLYTFILCLSAVIVNGQRHTNPDEKIGEYQYVHGGTQIIHIQHEKKDTIKKQSKTPKVKKALPSPFIGTSLGIGFHYYPDVACQLKGNWGLDMAFYCTDKFALGGYFKYHSIVQLSGGVLFIHNFKNPNTAFLWGIGGVTTCGSNIIGEVAHPVLPYGKFKLWNESWGAEIRLGYQFNKNWYMWLDMSHKESFIECDVIFDNDNYGSMHRQIFGEYEYRDNGYAFSTSISVGYKFNIKNKK